VATPGRLLDLLEKDAVNIAPKYVVLDEADEMLNMGFISDIRKIFNLISAERQTLMFSATMPDAIKKLAQDILNNPKEVKITPKNISNDNIEQFFYLLPEEKRNEALVRLLEVKKPEKAIIFCRTKVQTEKVNKFLKSKGYNSLALHGDIEQ
jgi:ATP-dependent RNA helicase DeaD